MKPPVILIADDDSISRVLMTKILRLAGYEIVGFADGRPALDWLLGPRETAVDLIVTDHEMPCPGVSLLAGLREAGVQLSAIVVSGRPRGEVTAIYRDLGPKAVLQKPLDRAALLHAVGAALSAPTAEPARVAEKLCPP